MHEKFRVCAQRHLLKSSLFRTLPWGCQRRLVRLRSCTGSEVLAEAHFRGLDWPRSANDMVAQTDTVAAILHVIQNKEKFKTGPHAGPWRCSPWDSHASCLISPLGTPTPTSYTRLYTWHAQIQQISTTHVDLA